MKQLALILLLAVLAGCAAPPRRVAVLTTVYRHNSHADIIASRLFQTDTLDGQGQRSPLQLAALYTDQVPANDTSRKLAAEYGFPIYPTIADALTLGTGALAVDGVLLIAEHGDYPRSPTGNTQYPKRRFWDETVAVFRASGRVVPVFVDKHLADNWTDAHHIYQEARELGIPLLAGSSIPLTWRHPAADVTRGAALTEIVAITYGSTDSYGFHALELVQALAEQRRGGETGIRQVQCVSGAAVWATGAWDPALFQAAWERLPRNLLRGRPLEVAVKQPLLFIVDYADGLRARILELNGAAGEWSAAWREAETGAIAATHAFTQEGRPGMHFTWLLHGIEELVQTGRPPWPAERTLLTSGTLDALLASRQQGGAVLPTPYLTLAYRSDWRWQQPPPPPPTRPWAGP
jgi:hypothetical protein